MAIQAKPYGTTQDGHEIQQFTITNNSGVSVSVINYGCRITHLIVPSKNGPDDVILGYDTLQDYEADPSSQGAFIGRYGNRIRGGQFELNGQIYTLTRKNGNPNYLHGSFSKRAFTPEVIGDNSISLTYTSPAGEDGFPGELWVGVIYTLTDKNELVMDYRANTTADTHVNLTNHTYFNLAGQESTTIENHYLELACSRFLEAGDQLLPTGRTLEVAGGAFDFTKEKRIGQDINNNDPQLLAAGGYDHNFIIDKLGPGRLSFVGAVREPESGRTMKVYTTQPGVQFYTSNSLKDFKGKNGRHFCPKQALCLETQHYPDTPNHPDFPSTVLLAGAKHHEITAYSFEW